MVCSILIFGLKRLVFPEEKIVPTSKETMVHVVPCYNESPEELIRSLDSLVTQTGIEGHARAIVVICDGRVRGPGMAKTAADHLLDDIFIVRSYRHIIKDAYTSWTHDLMDIEVQCGTYKGIPYYCIIKQQNQGKRDSLICVRSFLHTFNTRDTLPSAIFSLEFFNEMSSFLINDAGISYVDFLVGMDADTVFDDACVQELIREARYPETIGVCGYVGVDYTRSRFGNWSPWSLYQSTEYTISQALRRLHQSTVTKKVSCLPGCCQLLRVCETTCGNHILYELFGYCPKPSDSMLKHIRATASEDRNHVCLMLSAFPKAQTRQALRAVAYTDVPHSWSVFLSQRRRWSLGATSNDLFLITAPGIQWFERILATANCMVWFVNIFVFACIANLIVAALCESILCDWTSSADECYSGRMVDHPVFFRDHDFPSYLLYLHCSLAPSNRVAKGAISAWFVLLSGGRTIFEFVCIGIFTVEHGLVWLGQNKTSSGSNGQPRGIQCR
jgi:chitin synthase